MTTDYERILLAEGIGYSEILDPKFKTNTLKIFFSQPLSAATAAGSALATSLLTASNQRYPSIAQLRKKLQMLYGAAIFGSVQREGDIQTNHISATVIDDRYALEQEPLFDEVLELLAQFDRAWIFSAHTHNNKTNYTHTVGSKKIREYILGTSCGAWWHGTVCTDGAPNGYGVFEYDGTSLTNMIYKPTRYDETFQIRLYNGEDVFTGGTAKSWKFDLQQPKNRLMANVWNADDTWTIEVYENGGKTGDMAKKSMIDPWSSAYFCGFCGLKESYASKNDHIFYYTVKSPGAALRVVARDGYGNVFEQTEITTPLEADYPDAY
mgnify:CR=1 FL=1